MIDDSGTEKVVTAASKPHNQPLFGTVFPAFFESRPVLFAFKITQREREILRVGCYREVRGER